MKKLFSLAAIAALAPLMLAGCENPAKPRPTLRADFGDAVRHNMAVQILNPEGNPDFTPPPMDGARANDAVERYRAGVTKEVVRQRTSKMGATEK
jgi:type IV pilus biogenesis protein CpaD/CtpE